MVLETIETLILDVIAANMNLDDPSLAVEEIDAERSTLQTVDVVAGNVVVVRPDDGHPEPFWLFQITNGTPNADDRVEGHWLEIDKADG